MRKSAITLTIDDKRISYHRTAMAAHKRLDAECEKLWKKGIMCVSYEIESTIFKNGRTTTPRYVAEYGMCVNPAVDELA